MIKGYLAAVKAKFLQPVSKTFCLFPTDGANCCDLDRLIFETSTAQSDPCKKGRSDGGGSATSPMIKLSKRWRVL